MWIGVGAALSFLVVGAGWWQSRALERNGQVEGGGSVWAAAATVPVAGAEPAGVPELEPLFAADGLSEMAVSQKAGDGVARQAEGEVEPDAVEQVENEVPVSTAPTAPSGESYTWQDGDRALVVRLEPDLVLSEDGDVVSRDDVASGSEQAYIQGAQGDHDAAGSGEGQLVFRSEEGELMALPGGVVLVLDPGWDTAAVDGFFERNGIAATRATALDYVTNGFLIETEPGFASLDLANALAGQGGVVLSSPNWWKDTVVE